MSDQCFNISSKWPNDDLLNLVKHQMQFFSKSLMKKKIDNLISFSYFILWSFSFQKGQILLLCLSTFVHGGTVVDHPTSVLEIEGSKPATQHQEKIVKKKVKNVYLLSLFNTHLQPHLPTSPPTCLSASVPPA